MQPTHRDASAAFFQGMRRLRFSKLDSRFRELRLQPVYRWWLKSG